MSKSFFGGNSAAYGPGPLCSILRRRVSMLCLALQSVTIAEITINNHRASVVGGITKKSS